MTKKSRTARDLSVGVVITLGAVVFAAGIFSIGSEQRLWTRKVSYRLRLANTNGLQVGAPVRLVGVQVGTVTDILFPEDPNRVELEVVFTVDSAVQSRIRADTEATLKVLSVLGGDKFLELTPGSPSQPELPPDSYVRVPEGVGLEELQALGASIADDLSEVTGSLRVVLAQLQDRNTLLGQALFDPNFGRETLGSLKESVLAARDLLGRVEKGEGLAGRLLGDEEFADETLASIRRSLSKFESIAGRLADEEGPLAEALEPGGALGETLDNFKSASADLREIASGLREGKGVAGRLLTDDAYARELLADLKETTRELKEILGKINRGDGSAGAFLNDPGVYQDLRDVLRGVQKSRLMSRMIRGYREKGEKERLEEP